jgi:ribosomal protein L40E
MARFEQAEKRLFVNVWVCMKCNAKNRSSHGKKPVRCRKCKSSRLRVKKKGSKKG